MFVYKKSEVLDFSSFICRMAQQENYEKLLKKDNFKQLLILKESVLDAREQVPSLILQDLNVFIKEYKLDHWLDLTATETELSFSSWLEQLEAEGADAFLKSYQRLMFSMKEECTDAKVKRFLEEVRSHSIDDNRPQYKAYLEFSKDIQTVYSRWLECLKLLYPIVKPRLEALSDVFAAHEAELLKALSDEITFCKSMPFLDATLGEFQSKVVEVYMVPFFEYNLMYRMGKEPTQLYIGLLGYTLCQLDDNKERDAEMLRILADPTKFMILERLSQRPECGKDLAKALSLSKATISHHMSKLAFYGFIDVTLQEGKIVYYETKPDVIQTLFERLNKRFIKQN